MPENALDSAIEKSSRKFKEYFQWLEKTMPSSFFEEISYTNRLLITHALIGFDLQEYFSLINLKDAAIVLCLDSADADLRILKNFEFYGINSYQTYVSKEPAPFPGIMQPIRIALIEFTQAEEKAEKKYSKDDQQALQKELLQLDPSINEKDFAELVNKIGSGFLQTLPAKSRPLALHLLHIAEHQDNCQYEVEYEKEWQTKNRASMQVVLAWRNTPKHQFLYKLAQLIHRHGLIIKRVNATYVDAHSSHSVLVMAISLHGSKGKAAWETADTTDFLRELVTFKYFSQEDRINELLVSKNVISGNMGNLLRSMIYFIHQGLVNLDSHQYRFENIEEAFIRHPELTTQLCECFSLRFDPKQADAEKFDNLSGKFMRDVLKLDTGHEENDVRRRNILSLAMNFIKYSLKTNFYRSNYTAHSFRLDPRYLDQIPFDRSKKFPDLPFAIFFMKGKDFFGYHIRFKDLSRGGLRTVLPQQDEQVIAERNNVFNECYNLAWTQQKKNKDIPEGGSKAIIFVEPYDSDNTEIKILAKELEWSNVPRSEIDSRLHAVSKEQKLEHLYESQRAFIESFITIINCNLDGTLRAKNIIDYWKRPEYIYLGPDENMHDSMIEWIADFSKKYDYKPGGAFISSKPQGGINHKQYGVTSLGVNVYMTQVLKFLGIDPEKQRFTVKMSGGPDGDVAGNQLLNLQRFYPKTAKVLALTDGTGTIYDSEGLDLDILKELFHQNKGIRYYPPEKLSNGGFLLDKSTKRFHSAYVQETLCWRNSNGKLVEDWLSGSDMNHLYRSNVHQTKADIFIPAGGRPRTLNESNVREYLDEDGIPTSKAIIEGANLYLTPLARSFLEEKGVLIIKDSSANKGGVICSSFEVLSGLTLKEDQFLENKSAIVQEILERIEICARNEADILLKTHQETGEYLTSLSDKVSQKINEFKYQLLDYLDSRPWPGNIQDPLVKSFLNYALKTLKSKYSAELLKEIPDHHKKAIVACQLACQLVYNKGVHWSPSIVDILPLILH